MNEYLFDPPSCKAFLTGLNDLKYRKCLARSRDATNFVKENCDNIDTLQAKQKSLERKNIVNEIRQEETKRRK